MNYYNPYFMSAFPNMVASTPSKGLLSTIRGNVSLSSILNGTQKTLNFINQVIPVARQITPMMKNAKTMFRIMNEFKKVETPANEERYDNNSYIIPEEERKSNNNQSISYGGPTFFI